LNSRHVIESAVFEIDFDSQTLALEQQSDLDTFVKSRLLPVVEEVFETLDNSERVLTIDNLEIDLGIVGRADYRAELEGRLRNELSTKLLELHIPGAQPSARESRIVSSAESELEQLQQFLLTGHLPWNADPGEIALLEHLLRSALKSNSEQLVGFIRRAPHRAIVIERLVNQFDDAALAGIVKSITPAHADLLLEFVDMLQRMVSDEPSPDTAPAEARRRIWMRLLDELLKAGRAAIHPERLIEVVLESGGTHQPYERALEKMVETSAAPSASGLTPLLRSLASKERVGDGKGAGSEDAPAARGIPPSDATSVDLIRAYDLYDSLKQRLLSGRRLRPDAEVELKRVIDTLQQEHPAQLLRFYRELQSGVLSLAPVAATASVDILRHLVQGLIALTGEAGQTDFLRAIAAYAARTANTKQFYTLVLERLINIEIVDFESILAASSSVMEDAADEPPAQADDRLPPSNAATDGAIVAYLQALGPVSADEAARLSLAIELMMARRPERFRVLLQNALTSPNAVDRLIGLLPERLLTRVLSFLPSREHGRTQRYADIIATAGYTTVLVTDPHDIARLKWQFLFEYLREGRAPLDDAAFVRQFTDFLATQAGGADKQAFYSGLGRELMTAALPSTREDTARIVRALPVDEETRQAAADLLLATEAADEPPLPRRQRTEPPENPEPTTSASTERIYIINAGLVLASPYLPRLFKMLDLLQDTTFRDRHAAERGVHLLQYMVNGSTDSPEYQLVLNKLLCGIDTGAPIARAIEISDNEQELIEGLLQSMLSHWKSLGNTSVGGLRESFLQREGRLEFQRESWHLLVEPRAYDMLLDQIPWSFSTIRHPWMQHVIHVDWR